MNKKNILSLALALVVLTLTISPAADAFAQPAPDGQGRRHVARRRPAKRRKSTQAREIIYTCPMHSDVHLKSPGECPKCGMDLEVKKRVNAKSE